MRHAEGLTKCAPRARDESKGRGLRARWVEPQRALGAATPLTAVPPHWRELCCLLLPTVVLRGNAESN